MSNTEKALVTAMLALFIMTVFAISFIGMAPQSTANNIFPIHYPGECYAIIGTDPVNRPGISQGIGISLPNGFDAVSADYKQIYQFNRSLDCRQLYQKCEIYNTIIQCKLAGNTCNCFIKPEIPYPSSNNASANNTNSTNRIVIV